MERAQQVIDSLVLKAPIDGVVAVKDNRDAMGGHDDLRHGHAGVPRGRHRVAGRPSPT
jgi:hypothetical protein